VNYTVGEKVAMSLGDLGDLGSRKRIDTSMFGNGVYTTPASRFSPSLAHTEEDIAETGTRLGTALKQVLEKWPLP
jgi:glutamate-1-semialdehyde aminotransferase